MHRTEVGRKWDEVGTEVGPNRDEVDFCKEGHLGVPWLSGEICNKCTGRKWDGNGTKLGRKWDEDGTEVGRRWDEIGQRFAKRVSLGCAEILAFNITCQRLDLLPLRPL